MNRLETGQMTQQQMGQMTQEKMNHSEDAPSPFRLLLLFITVN